MGTQVGVVDKGASLHQLWASNRSKYLADVDSATKLARDANRAGEHFLAIDIADAVSQVAGDRTPIALRQAQALALARIGSSGRALKILTELGGEKATDAETLGLTARIYKELGLNPENSEKRDEWLHQAQHLYQLGLERAGSSYCGINAAALSVLLGNFDEASQLAALTLRQTSQNDDYYDLATRAEAALIQKNEKEAASLYQEACAAGHGKSADIAITHRQCRLLSSKLYGAENKFDNCFPSGAIAIFAGHIVDLADRQTPRFPPTAEKEVFARIDKWLHEKDIQTSFSSAAAGSDIIFLTAAQKAGIETHIVLPFAAADFIETSVRPAGAGWVERFNAILDRSKSLTIANDQAADDRSASYDFTNRLIAAKATLRANDLHLPVFGLAVWDRQRGDAGGGTADAVSMWCRANVKTDAIHPTNPKADGPVCDTTSITAVPFERTQAASPDGYLPTVSAVLHVYFENYYTMRDREYPKFRESVLIPIAQLVAKSEYAPESSYGLGSDYAFVFRTMRNAGMFADELRRTLSESALFELPRMSLHAGPMFLMVNPVMNQYCHEGSTLTRAARMARRLRPGAPFCTEPFAALSALEAIREFRFEYAGSQDYPDGTSDRLFTVRYHD